MSIVNYDSYSSNPYQQIRLPNMCDPHPKILIPGKFRREFRNALEKCRCGRIRVEDRSLYHNTPAMRINNISPSSRSNYQLTSVRDITSLRDRHVSTTTNTSA